MSNDIRKYISILTEAASANRKYYTKDNRPDLDAFPDIARASKDDNGNYGSFQQWLIDNKKTHREHYRSWKAQSPTPNAFTDTGMIQQYFDQNLDQYSEFIDWYEENKDRYIITLSTADFNKKFAEFLKTDPEAKREWNTFQTTQMNNTIAEMRVGNVEIPNNTIAAFLKAAPAIGQRFFNSFIPSASAAAQDSEELGQDPVDTVSSSTSSEPVAPDSSGGSGANPSDQAMGTFSQGGGQGGAPQDQTPPAPDQAPARDQSGIGNPFDGGTNTTPARDQSGIRNPFDGGTNTTPARDQSGIRNPFDGGTNTTSSAVQSQADTADPENDVLPNEPGGTNTTSTATTTPATQSAATTPPQQQQPPVPKPRPAAQPKYYPGVTEPDYNKSLRIAQNTLKQAQQKLSQGNLSNLDKMQAQTDVQRQNQLINMYQNDLLANPRTERGNLIHHRNMLNRSAVASGQAGDQKTRAGYKKQAAQVSQQLKTVKESRFTNLQNYINKL